MTNTLDAARQATIPEAWECMQWLWHEAEILDANRVREWLELLTADIDYRLPIRVTRERDGGSEFSADGYHMYEDYDSLLARVDRLDTDFAWAEDPPSRTRRIVSNVRVTVGDGPVYHVRSNFLIFRSRLDATTYELLLGERRDRLVTVDDLLKLQERVILLDHTTIASKNLAIFF
jgi:3-phenylpropionate/cinnamic acid dioxygenase small subunit